MNCNALARRLPILTACLLALASFSCDEKLPVYVEPKNILSLRVSKVEQLSDRQAPPVRRVSPPVRRKTEAPERIVDLHACNAGCRARARSAGEHRESQCP